MFGIAIVEAMASALPVVATALSTGVREVVDPDVTGLLIPPGDAPALAAAMERLASDAELRHRMGEAGRDRVEARFTEDGMVDAHLELCEELVARQ
jgi:glycosyltransferase involved in cell wall biosynthesis